MIDSVPYIGGGTYGNHANITFEVITMSSSIRATLIKAMDSLNNGGKLADVKASLTDLKINLPSTKAAALVKLEELLDSESCDSPVKDKAQADSDLGLPALSLRDEVEIEIKKELVNAGNSTMRIGALLIEAKEDFDKTDDFLSWVVDKFGIGKAWAYRLMKVAKSFGADPRFAGVDVNVLYALGQQADEGQIANAAIIAQSGKLTIKSLKTLFGEKVPEPKSPASQPAGGVSGTNPDVIIADEIEPVPFDTGAGVSLPNLQGNALANMKEPPVFVSEAVSEAIGEQSVGTQSDVLVLKIAELTKTINLLMKENQELKQPRLERKVAQAPELPQFNHKKLYVRLGITEDESMSVAAVQSAYRALVTAGYGRGHSCFDKIEEAFKAYNK